MTSPISGKKTLGAELILLSVAFIWGTTFTIVKEALADVQVFVFLGQRFLLAFAFFLPFLWVSRQNVSKQALVQGLFLGLFLFGAYGFQTMGLKYTSASNAAFVTGLNVVLVPVFNSFIFKRVIPGNVLTGVVLAALGLAGLCLGNDLSVNSGDLIVILCAACIAFHIIFTGRFANQSDVYWLAGIQVGVVGLLSLFTAWGQGQEVFVWKPGIVWALIVCAPLASTYAFWAQTSMQRFTIPTKTALIFCMEPVFGALYARFMGGEYLGRLAFFGAGLILLGMLLVEVPQVFRLFFNPSRNRS